MHNSFIIPHFEGALALSTLCWGLKGNIISPTQETVGCGQFTGSTSRWLQRVTHASLTNCQELYWIHLAGRQADKLISQMNDHLVLVFLGTVLP